MMACGCSCGGDCKVTLLYACSGAANTGLLADQVARTLSAREVGGMTCLSGVAANLSGFVVSAQEADRNVVIDGCKVGCGARIFKEKGLPFEQYIITDFGVTKGETEITAELIESISDQIAQRIQ